MSEDDAQPRDLAEIQRLVTALAEHMLAFDIPAPPMDPARAKALIGAAHFLDDNDVPLPPAVQQALRKIRERMGAP